MNRPDLSPAVLKDLFQRFMAQRREAFWDFYFKRPANLKRAAYSSVSQLTLLSVGDRLPARQLAEILAGAYHGLGLDHFSSEPAWPARRRS